MNSPIIPMIKKALAAPEDHSLQAIKMSDSPEPMKLISNVTTNLWSEEIPVSYWNFSLKKNAYKQIWLPPYQFQPTSHRLKNVDRAIKTQKNAVFEKVTVVEKPQEPKVPLRLVNFEKGMNKKDRSI